MTRARALDEFERQLVEQRTPLMRLALRLTRDRSQAEDLVQDAMLSALHARDSFEPGSAFGRWMATIVFNRFYHLRRLRSNKLQHDEISQDDETGVVIAQPAGQEHRIALVEVQAAIRAMPDWRRAALASAVAEEPIDRGCRRLGIPEGTLKSRISRVRRDLREQFA